MATMKKGKMFGVVALAATVMIGAAIIVNQMVGIGLRINLSHSAPIGVWRVSPFDAAKLVRGELVEVCPPAAPIVKLMVDRGYLDRGNCASTHVTPLLKAVGALPDDTVTIQHGSAVAVNGQPVPNTAAMASLPAWPDGTYIVQPGHVWLFSTYTSVSFDSRYFGPVAIASIRGKAIPVLVHGEVADMARVGRNHDRP